MREMCKFSGAGSISEDVWGVLERIDIGKIKSYHRNTKKCVSDHWLKKIDNGRNIKHKQTH